MSLVLVEVTVKKVEPLPGRQAGRSFVAKAPFADLPGRVIGALEHLCYGDVLWPKVILAVSSDVAMAGVQAGHQDAPRWGAHGRACMKVGEPHAVLGQAVDVRRLDEFLSVATQIAITKVIRHDVNDIGLRPVRFRDFGRRGGRKHVPKKRA